MTQLTDEAAMNEHPRPEVEKLLDQFKSSADKFSYLSGLKDLSWEDCCDAFYAAKELIPEVSKEIKELESQLAQRDKQNAELVELVKSRTIPADELYQSYSDFKPVDDAMKCEYYIDLPGSEVKSD